MKAPDTIIIEGRAYSWRVLLELRKAQLDAWRKAKPSQPKLFDLKKDCRPKACLVRSAQRVNHIAHAALLLRAHHAVGRRALSGAELARRYSRIGRVAVRHPY